jgi:hypothetical protein
MSTLRLYPAGNCLHCDLEIEETHMLEMVARESGLPDRMVTILVHSGSDHERCEGRATSAERRTAGP